MRGMKNHRLFVASAELILQGMKKLQLPAPAELYSLELRARRARAEEIGRLLRKAAAALVAVLEHAGASLRHGPRAKGVRHA